MMEKKILIVDDEFNSRTLLAQLFQEDGYSADTAENGKTALEALKSTPFDILITDIRMPVMDGIELFHRAKEMYPHMPVILFTAYGTIEAAVNALKEGVFHYLEKPVNFDLLKHTVQQALEIQDLEKEIINLRKQLGEKKTDQP
jgi:two-component system response regulator HydG